VRRSPDPSTSHPHELVEAARSGDEEAFGSLVDAHRRELHVHCYRMLGSLQDAEDALQEVLVRAWRALPQLERSDWLRAWLYKIATNVCLTALSRRGPRRLPADQAAPGDRGGDPGEPLAHSVWIEPYPDEKLGPASGLPTPEARYEQREAVELAFIASLQFLPARQRAVLILRDVLAFSAREVATLLDTSVPAVNSCMQRARRTLDERLPDQSQQDVLRLLGDEQTRDLVTRFADAFERGDVEGIIDLLVEDATFTMPPYDAWYRGRDAVARSWLMPDAAPPVLRAVVTRASGQPALAFYRLDEREGAYLPLALDVLTVQGGRIAAVTAFRNPGLFRQFDLPDRL